MSENYIVSARKYRPQTFDTVVGQEHITTTLKNAVRTQQLAHAYLFCGPRGVGKTTCARILARTINCEQPTSETEACGTCATCVSFGRNTSFNIFELDAASNNSVEDIRNLIDQVRFAPQQGRYKIYIIDEVHMLSASAFNAFLKTLEEPPAYAIFILATTEKHKILPTILSRCQIFDFKRITSNDITGHLRGITEKEGLQAEDAALHVIAQKSEGCMRDALSMLDRIAGFTGGSLSYGSTMEHLNLLDADFYFGLTDNLLAQDVSSTLLLLDQALERGFEGDVVLGGMAEFMRNLLLCKDARMAKLLEVPKDHQKIYFEKANRIPPAFILSALNLVHEAELGYKNAVNKRLHTELCLIRLCYVLQATKVPSGEEKKNSADGPAVAAAGMAEPPRAALPAAPPPAAAQPAPAVAVSQSPPAPVAVPAPPQPAIQPSSGAVEVPPPVARPAVPPARTGAGKRISLNMLDELEQTGSSTAGGVKKELTEELATTLFEEFRQQMKAANREMMYAQLSLMRTAVFLPDEVRVISPNEMTNEYALNVRNNLLEYFSEHTGMIIRITTEVDRQETGEGAPRVLSTAEVYEQMAAKNPDLAKLKEGLNLGLDY